MRTDIAYEETIFSLSTEVPKQPERRQQPRHMTILRVGTLIVDGRRELCLIRNISAGGVMAHVYSVLDPGQRLALELKTNHQVSGTVTWADESNIGITFDAPIDVEEMLASQSLMENGWRTRLPRVEVDRLAMIRLGARSYPVSTRDISQGGVKLETDNSFAPGDEIVLALEKLRPVSGVVRWYHEGTCGVAFNQVIPFHELMSWLRAN